RIAGVLKDLEIDLAMAIAKEAEAKKKEAEAVKKEAEAKRKEEAAISQLEDIEKEKKEAQEALHKTQLKLLTDQVDSALEMREYANVVKRAEEALLTLKENPLFGPQIQGKLERQIELAKGQLGIAPVQLQQSPFQSAISADGETVALMFNSSGEQKRRIEFRTFSAGDNSAPERIQELPLPDPYPLRSVFVSGDGNSVCAVGAVGRILWRRDDSGQFAEMTMPDLSGRPRQGWKYCLFSQNHQHLYMIGDNQSCTLEILDLKDTAPKSLLRTTLYPENSGNYACGDIALTPDEQWLIFVSSNNNDGYCRAFPLKWNEGIPTLELTGKQAPSLDGMEDPKVRISGGTEAIRRLTVFPDGQHLLVGMENEGDNLMIVLPRIQNPGRGQFPFSSPAQLQNLNQFSCVSRGLPVQITISRDGRTIAGQLANKRNNIQIWQQNDEAFGRSNVPGLYLSGPSEDQTLLSGHSGVVQALAFRNAAGTQLTSVSIDPSIIRWDLDSYGDYLELLEEVRDSLPSKISAIPPAPGRRNGAQVSTGVILTGYFPGGESRADESEKAIILDQGQKIFSAEFSQDGKRILVGADDLAAHVFQSDSGNRTLSMSGRIDLLQDEGESNYFIEGHNSDITGVRFLPPDGDLMLTSENFGVISVWDAKADADGIGYERSRLLPRYSSSDFAVSKDGKWIIAGGAEMNPDENVPVQEKLLHMGMLWRADDVRRSLSPDPALLLRGEHAAFEITAVGISPESTRAVTCGRRGKIAVWAIPEGTVVASSNFTHGGDGISATFFLNESELVTAGYDGKVLRWTIGDDGKLNPTVIHSGQMIVRMAPSSDSTRIAVTDVIGGRGGDGVVVSVLDLSGSVLKELTRRTFRRDDPGFPMRSGCSWSSDDKMLMHVLGGSMTLYDTSSWKATDRFVLDEPSMQPLRGAFGPSVDGKTKFATLNGRQAHLWQLPDGDHLAEFRTHHTDRIVASFSADRRFVVTGSETIRVFDGNEDSATRGRTIFRIRVQDSHRHPISSAEFSPVAGDLRFLTCDQTGEVRIWNWQEGQGPPAEAAHILPAVKEEIPNWALNISVLELPSVARWSLDGRRIAAVCQGRVKCWNLTGDNPTEISLPMPDGFDFRFNDVTFSRTSNLVTAGGIGVKGTDDDVKIAACVWRIEDDGSVTLVASLVDEENHSSAIASDNRDPGDNRAGGITSIWLDHERSLVITGTEDAVLHEWSLPAVGTGRNGSFEWTGRLEQDRSSPHSSRISAVQASEQGRIVTTDEKGRIVVWPAGVLGKVR
ncbi:MAG: hypothetical protein KDA96_14675, partial [Planctomycetaceae bacterium]|nr:hypothetical protein [Planctomycetaceae bacterium]